MARLDSTRYRFISDALNGEGVFRPSVSYDAYGKAASASNTCLVQYPRESSEKFARRNEVAWYENHIRSACMRFVGYLAKKPPLRDITNPLLTAMSDDCNWRGDSIDIFLAGLMVDAKARGCMLLLVDMPRTVPADAASQMDERAIPYLVPILPEQVVNYEINVRGLLDMVEINDRLPDGTSVIRGWDESRWWVRKGDQEIEGDDHRLGACPVLAFSETGDFPDFGDFAQIADLSKRLFNARSELDEILRAQTFSILAYQVPAESASQFNASSVAENIGTHNMLVHHGDQPAFIAPPDGPAQVYLDVIAKLEEAIKRVSLTVEAPEHQSAESGVALTIRFQSLNSALTAFARRMEDFERRIWWLATRWLSLSGEQVTVSWAKDFALADVKAEMETLGAMQISGFPAEATRLKMKQISALDFSTADQEDLQTVFDAIDAGASEVSTQ